MNRFVSALSVMAILFPFSGQDTWAQTAPAQIVKERQDAMGDMWTDYYRDIIRTLRSSNPDLTLVANKASGAIEHLKKLEQLFPPGTGRDVVPETRAKPEIWTNQTEFDGAFKALIDATKVLGEAAKKGDVEGVKAEWQTVSKACGACHGGPKKSGGQFRFEQE